MSDGTYKLEELAHAAGTSSRTVRYYVQRGLLPAPRFRGKDTVYDREHLIRLQAIRKLQDAYLPLDAIAVELEGKSLDELERIADGRARSPAPIPPPRPRDPIASARGWRRLTVAPGLEVSIADDAPDEVRAIAGRLVEILEAMSSGKEGAKR